MNDLLTKHPLIQVDIQDSVTKVITEITRSRVGAVIVNDKEQLRGFITDGDIRRMLQEHNNFMDLTAAEIMNPNPKSIENGALAIDALEILKQFKIAQLVVTEKHQALGIIHIQDLIEEGII